MGRDPENDFVIDNPEVSTRHARVLIAPGGNEGVVEDLGSTNGTSVGSPGNRAERATIVRTDTLYFGPVAVPAERFFPVVEANSAATVPELVLKKPVMTVGRDAGCDLLVDFPVVSSRHARFVHSGGLLMVEDLGSSNGTFVNGRRIDRTSTVNSGDLIGLGSYTLRLVDGSGQVADDIPSTEAILYGSEESVTYRPPAPAPVSAAGTPLGNTLPAVVAVATQSVVLPLLILAAARDSTAQAFFWLSIAAVWQGFSASLFTRFKNESGKPSGLAGLLREVLFTSLLDSGASVLMLGLASWRFPLGSGWPWAFGVLWLTALIGSALGIAVNELTNRLAVGIAAGAGLVVLMGLLGAPHFPCPLGVHRYASPRT